MEYLSRKEIIQEALERFGGVIVCESMDEAVDFANELAPEHLEICVDNPFSYIGRLDNAGSVFLGHYSPEPLGDYFAGPNHVLPTGGTAVFSNRFRLRLRQAVLGHLLHAEGSWPMRRQRSASPKGRGCGRMRFRPVSGAACSSRARKPSRLTRSTA